ncbi:MULTISPECIES: ABC transporter permease [Pseudomonas]|uniref:Transport permease protein n=1 Tax=Pseudomonas koreensis TaxID=198620 RepID=A0A9X2XGU4_9PSED|nr:MULTISPECIES: ABC transporter permease [Pseudomonas]MBV4474329.1 ABC transporter permease [Pseudomonas botevensis]MCU7248707.1 ABC transporter permease [Pseudomonas koreensis]
MQKFSASPVVMFTSVVRNRALIAALIKREVIGRYRGSFMGILWSFFNPIVMLSIYTFVFGLIFNSRWAGAGDSKPEFALILFAGLIVFNLFSECVTRAPNLIISNANYVKKVVFPLEILPCVVAGASLFHALISLIVWVAAYLIVFGVPPVTALYLPLVVAPLVLIILGLSWALASLGVYMRDVAHFIGLATSGLMFLAPIFYPATAVPEEYRGLLQLNPLTVAVENVRSVLFFGQQPDWQVLGIYSCIGVLVAYLGFAWFQKTRKGFADVL